jgi:prepilin-type N-terminal cleavage/methylation domain-containing protein/prepilin-type processing-associated H-X9-DG protein
MRDARHSIRRSTRPRRRAGFTLVELLVVIGIIAILIAILLPSLNAARRQANTVKCLSNLRQLGYGFHAYAHNYKGAFPVNRQDLPDFNGVIVNSANWYWEDFIIPYVSKTGQTSGQITNAKTFAVARDSVMWGCPAWPGWPGQDAYTFQFGISRFENGYTMNIWPTCEPDYPGNGTQMPPNSETQMRWAQTYEGKHYKITQWTHAGERMLLVDANLWILGFIPADNTHTIAQQQVGRGLNQLAGGSNIDRYRHGRYPPNNGSTYLESKGGRVGYNILYVDGHAVTSESYKDGYRAVRMRDP